MSRPLMVPPWLKARLEELLPQLRKAFDESRVRRHPKGTSEGGRFMSGAGAEDKFEHVEGKKNRAMLDYILRTAVEDGVVVQAVRHEGNAGGRKSGWDRLGDFPWLVVLVDAQDDDVSAAAHARNIRDAYYKARARLREAFRDSEASAYEGRG